MIKLLDDYYINANSSCFILCSKKKTVKDGKEKETTTNIGYYISIADCLSGLYRTLTRNLTAKEDMTLQQAIAEFRRIEDNIRRIAQGGEDF